MLTKKFGHYLTVLALVSASLCAEEAQPLEPSQPLPPTDPARYITQAEFASIEQFRAQEEQNNAADTQKPIFQDPTASRETVTSGAYAALLYTGVSQLPIWFAADNTAIQLQDGSIWQVAYSDINKVKEWKFDQFVYITPNRWGYLSSYRFEMVNVSTREIAEINYMKPSFINDHVVKGINYDDNRVALNEGFDIAGNPVYSYWTVSSSDYYLLNKWLPEDKIIVGVNIGFTAYSNPYILINIYTGTYVHANFNYTGY